MYLLDTNIASHVIRDDLPRVRERLVAVPMYELSVSVVTQAELLYGVAKRGHPPGLTARVREFLLRVQVVSWTPEVGEVYGTLRSACEARGVSIAPMRMMIATHAVSLKAILVTRDRAFGRVEGLKLADWAC